MAGGLLLLATSSILAALLMAAIIFGAGFGLYLGVDIALAIRVLPSASARGKDLGLMYNAVYLPLILSPLLGGAVLSLWPLHFSLLFVLAAGSSVVVSAALLIPIRAVK